MLHRRGRRFGAAMCSAAALAAAAVLVACTSEPPQALTTTFPTTAASADASASSASRPDGPSSTAAGLSSTATSSTGPASTDNATDVGSPTRPTSDSTSAVGTGATTTPGTTRTGSGESDPPTSRPATTPITSTSPTSRGTLVTLTSGVNEAADRAAIEAQWVKFWELYPKILTVPEAKRRAYLTAVAKGEVLEQVLTQAKDLESHGQKYFGSAAHRVYWPIPVGGHPEAVIGDCLDLSEFGVVDKASGKRVSHGFERDNSNGSFQRDDDGVWRLVQLQWRSDVKC